MSEELIIANRTQQDRVIEQLLAAKNNAGGELLLTYTSGDLDDTLRVWYQSALDHEIILMINLVILQLGQNDPSTNKVSWNHQNGSLKISASYSSAHHTTEVKVNNLTVCSNSSPGERIFIPGQWVLLMRDEFRRIEDKRAWKAEITERAKKERLILMMRSEV
jgi:hypothetical protein